ncbi:10822_t:CDS:2, partial [Ambispora gerdemannii]
LFTSYLPTSRQPILSYCSRQLVSATKDTNLDWLLGKYVSAEKLQRVKLLFEIERMNSLIKIEKNNSLIKDKEVAIKDKEIEIAKIDKALTVTKNNMGYLNLNYLRLKGAVHHRGVF